MASATASTGSSGFHNTHSNNYDKMASNSTFSVARIALADPIFTSFPINSSSYILDNACGTGIVTSLLKSQHPNVRILGVDLAPGMIETFKAKVAEKGWENVESKVVDSRKLEGLEDGMFSHVVTNFGFMPGTEEKESTQKVAEEIWRVLGDGGLAVVTTWAERNFTEALEAAALFIRPTQKPFAWDVPDEWARGSWLTRQLEDAGFGNRVTVKRVEGRMEAPSLEELVDNMMGMKDMFYKGYSEEEVRRLPGVLKEKVKNLKAYDERDENVGIKMVAWVGFAWK